MTSRVSARVIVVDGLGRVLLFRDDDPERPHWFPPGGGVLPGETIEDAAHRELREETGLDVIELGTVVLTRDVEWSFEGETYEQREYYFRVDVEPFDVDATGWTELERRVIAEWRWWTPEELAATRDTVYPEGLLNVIVASSADRT
jgi:ADP-ribose pyrophosphatase YjhB (NUDIX family)